MTSTVTTDLDRQQPVNWRTNTARCGASATMPSSRPRWWPRWARPWLPPPESGQAPGCSTSLRAPATRPSPPRRPAPRWSPPIWCRNCWSAVGNAPPRAGIEPVWQEANAEALPYGDGEFDAVLSCIGVMFAPHHEQAAAELTRVCRPGGTIGVISWTPEGFIGQMFATMKPYVAAPPPGVSAPPLWGNEEHVTALFGDRVRDLVTERRTLTVDRFASGSEFRDFFKANYGPTITAYRGIASDADRTAELDAALADLGDRALAGSTASMPWEYLLVTARSPLERCPQPIDKFQRRGRGCGQRIAFGVVECTADPIPVRGYGLPGRWSRCQGCTSPRPAHGFRRF